MSLTNEERETKLCSRCKSIKPLLQFGKASYHHRKDGIRAWCKNCRNEAARIDRIVHPERERQKHLKYRLAHPELLRKKNRDWLNKVKVEILTHYGNDNLGCVRCGFPDIRALSIDHVHGNGASHLRILKRQGSTFYSWLRVNKYPEGYQTLCMNCQWIKRHENKETR